MTTDQQPHRRSGLRSRKALVGAAAVATGGALALGLTPAGPAAAHGLINSARILDNSIRSIDIRDNTIQSRDIRDNTIRMPDLAPAVRDRIAASGASGAQGPAGPAGATGAQGPAGQDNVLGTMRILNQKVVQYIGGSFGERATVVAQKDLAQGTYLVSMNANFQRTDDQFPEATPVLQLNVGVPAGAATPLLNSVSAFTGAFPKSAVGTIEQTASGGGILTVTQDTTVTVRAFGYDPVDRGGAGSGDFTVTALVDFVKINV